MDWKNRAKNYGFWTAIISQIVVMVSLLNIVDVTQLQMGEKVALSILEFFVVLGIVNNPTVGKGFGDSPK